jgi:3,4-dihydroxy 2-butanone 4-phosphate synthase/GTP cyclohydrolase II
MAYAVTVDATEGISTGISAADRARTIRLLADPATSSTDLSRPGHVVPARVRTGGVLRRPGSAEAAVDLAVCAGLRPAAALCRIVSVDDPRRMAGPRELRRFADQHGLALITVTDLVAHRLRTETAAARVAAAVPLHPFVQRPAAAGFELAG